MSSFSCSKCGGEFHVRDRATFTCPNCNITLSPEGERVTEFVATAPSWGSLGEPLPDQEVIKGQVPDPQSLFPFFDYALRRWLEHKERHYT